MSDKIVQAITEVELEISDDMKCHIDPDVKEKMAARIATFLVKGVGNPNPVYDMFVQAHNDGKYPMDSPQGRGDNLKDYTNRTIAMFTTKKTDLVTEGEGGAKMLTMAKPAPIMTSHKGTGEQYTEPVPPKASEKEPLPPKTESNA